MEASVFNPVQLHLLKMFAYDSSEDTLSEVKAVLVVHLDDFARLFRKALNQ